jgi:hypothetical protein
VIKVEQLENSPKNTTGDQNKSSLKNEKSKVEGKNSKNAENDTVTNTTKTSS